MKRLVSLTVLVLATTTMNGFAQNGNSMTVKWSDPSRPGLLSVSVLFGSVSVKTHSGNDVVISGSPVARRRPDVTADGLRRIDPGGTDLVVEEANNVITVSSQSPWNGGNLNIEVPVKTNLKLQTTNGGRILVEGVEGELEVNSVNGTVRLDGVSGSVVANATNGRLEAVLKQVTPNKPMSFVSMNANVDVTLPPDIRANLRVRTFNGAAYSDFDIQRSPDAAPVAEDNRNTGGRLRISTDRTINGAINGGGPDFEFRTLNGNIYIRKAK